MNQLPEVRVVEVGADSRPVIDALTQLYVYDFSEMLGLDVGEDGRFTGPRMDGYWVTEGHHAYLIRAGSQLAGFALVEGKSRLTGEPLKDMSQFFVLRRFRRRGVGAEAARWLFARFRGRWEVREAKVNVGATAFWRRVISDYTSGHFTEAAYDDEQWHGPVQRFVSGGESG
jgi:predicted acetyltransferase